MKIISKTKDYYDWLISKYGVDPLLTYDRRLPGGNIVLEKYFRERLWSKNEIINFSILIGDRRWDFKIEILPTDNNSSINRNYKLKWIGPQDLLEKWEKEKPGYNWAWIKDTKPYTGKFIKREEYLGDMVIANINDSYIKKKKTINEGRKRNSHNFNF